jgi:membrane dipeptidase
MTPAICLDAAAPGVIVRGIGSHHERLRQGGVDAVLATVAAIEPPEQTLLALGRWWSAHHAGEDPVAVATTATEIRTAVAEGKTAVVLHFQGTTPLAADVDMVDAYHRLGVRVMQLTYNYRVAAGDGCLEPSDAGLSEFGRKVVRRLERLSMLPDVSHAGERTARDVLRVADGPVIASHANARAICDSPRNLSDAVIDEVAASGGVIGVCAFPAFVASEGVPTISMLVDHVAYIADRIGIDRVGIGLDFADEDEEDYDYFGYDPRYYPRPPWTWPEGLTWWEDVRNLRPALAQRGFAEHEIDGVLGENFMRLFAQVWG